MASGRRKAAKLTPNKRSVDYWKKRFVLLEEAQHREADEFVSDLLREYDKALSSIERDILAWYERFAKNNDISLADARRWLTARELKELQWNVKEYIRYAWENALNQRWLKELENASARVHIDRLSALKLQIRSKIEALTGKEAASLESHMRSTYQEGYWHGAYEIQRGAGVGWQLEPLAESRIEGVIRKPWTADGVTFSKRVWTNQDKLLNALETRLTQALIRGEGSRSAISAIAKEMGVARHRAETLVRTEMAHFQTIAQRDSFATLDVQRYRNVATLDMKTSEICQDMDGTEFPMSEFEPGVTAPPFHPRCRTAISPAFDERWGERAARDADGKTYYVPADMTYKQWIADQEHRFGKERVEAARKMAVNQSADRSQYKQYKSLLGNAATGDFKVFQQTKYLDKDGYAALKADYRRVNRENAILMTAKSAGGHYSGKYADASAWADVTVKRAAKSYAMQVDEHRRKITSPDQYDTGWAKKTAAQQNGLLRKWKKDVVRNGELGALMRSILRERGL